MGRIRGWLLLVCAFGGCQPATAIMLDVTTDVSCGGPLTGHVATSITVGRIADVDQRPPAATVTRCDAATGRIGSLAIVPSGAEDAEVAVRVVTAVDKDPAACDPASAAGMTGCIVARRALRFVPQATIDVAIVMSAACEGIACPQDQTCSAGSCAPLENTPNGAPLDAGEQGEHDDNGDANDQGDHLDASSQGAPDMQAPPPPPPPPRDAGCDEAGNSNGNGDGNGHGNGKGTKGC
jgi:hypothetical protein